MHLPSHHQYTKYLTGAIVVVLVIALVIQFRMNPSGLQEPTEVGQFAIAIPREVLKWKGRDEQLGLTEAGSEAALKTLNCNDYVFRRYFRGSQSFSIYVAYWAAGRMPTRLVASHTPDRCWTASGLRCVAMRFREKYRLFERQLLPAEYRVFTVDSAEKAIHVAYWHTVEGKLYDYGERFNAIPDPWLWWKDTMAQAAYGSREQLFVRIASETPFEELWQEPGFQTVMKAVADLGLWATLR